MIKVFLAAAIAIGGFSAMAVTTSIQAHAGDWKDCTHEGGVCNPKRYHTAIRYGVPGKWDVKFTTGKLGCRNGVFKDKARGKRKHCEAYFPNWEKCTHEGGRCTAGSSGLVRYGTSPHKSNKFAERNIGRNKGITCSNAAFGRDPVRGKRKNCWTLR